MVKDGKILIGAGDNPVYLIPRMANRHGLIAGGTGTGKTVTLKVLAEGFSQMGVPVFLADVKGDVSTLAFPGSMSSKTQERLEKIGVTPQEFEMTGFPLRFWDVFRDNGLPVRATVSDLGPLLLARLMNLNEIQQRTLNVAFHVADDMGWEILDYKDLREVLAVIGEERQNLATQYGNVSLQTIGVIQGALLELEDQGADFFFGEPDLNIEDWMRTDENGMGMINILHCVELIKSPLLYATFMVWMLGELFEHLPEAGDLDKPKLVFFFDEAHMLFSDAPKAMIDKVAQVVKLVRSKGVGVYFITQNPSDIPNEVLSQLNNRIQHALRAYTPADQKAVKAAAQSFRANPKFKTEEAISNMGTGVALVSTLDEDGAPTIVEVATIAPPQSCFDPMTDAQREANICADDLYDKYYETVDRISAYELIQELREEREKEAEELLAEQEAEAQRLKEEKEAEKQREREEKAAQREAERKAREAEREAERKAREKEREEERKRKQKEREKEAAQKRAIKTVERTTKSVGREVTKSISRGILGTKSKNSSLTSAVASGLISGLFGR